MNYWIGVVSRSHVLRGVAGGFVPWRIDVDYQLAQPVPIKPLIAQLEFITDKTHWGVVFRFGQLKISESDFRKIAASMGCCEKSESFAAVQTSLF